MIDPVISISSALVLSVIFASAASHKLKNLSWFRLQVQEYELVPKLLVPIVALILPIIEVIAALGLLWSISRPYAGVLGLVLISLYALAITINLLKGRVDIDCGCSGPAMKQPLQSGLLVRNLFLAIFAFGSIFPNFERLLGLHDFFIAIAAATTAVLLYTAADLWLANRPALLKLIGEK